MVRSSQYLRYDKCPKISNTLLHTFFGLNFAFMQLFLIIFSEVANSVDPDQTASLGAVWSGSALFAYAILSAILVTKFKDIYRIYSKLRTKWTNIKDTIKCTAFYSKYYRTPWLLPSPFYILLIFLKAAELVANSVEPDQMTCSAVPKKNNFFPFGVNCFTEGKQNIFERHASLESVFPLTSLLSIVL